MRLKDEYPPPELDWSEPSVDCATVCLLILADSSVNDFDGADNMEPILLGDTVSWYNAAGVFRRLEFTRMPCLRLSVVIHSIPACKHAVQEGCRSSHRVFRERQ